MALDGNEPEPDDDHVFVKNRYASLFGDEDFEGKETPERSAAVSRPFVDDSALAPPEVLTVISRPPVHKSALPTPNVLALIPAPIPPHPPKAVRCLYSKYQLKTLT